VRTRRLAWHYRSGLSLRNVPIAAYVGLPVSRHARRSRGTSRPDGTGGLPPALPWQTDAWVSSSNVILLGSAVRDRPNLHRADDLVHTCAPTAPCRVGAFLRKRCGGGDDTIERRQFERRSNNVPIWSGVAMDQRSATTLSGQHAAPHHIGGDRAAVAARWSQNRTSAAQAPCRRFGEDVPRRI
jgi:hypothetical protein